MEENRVIKEYYIHVYTKRFENLKEMFAFLAKYKLLKWFVEEIKRDELYH